MVSMQIFIIANSKKVWTYKDKILIAKNEKDDIVLKWYRLFDLVLLLIKLLYKYLYFVYNYK